MGATPEVSGKRAKDYHFADRRQDHGRPSGRTIKGGPNELEPNQAVMVSELIVRDPRRGHRAGARKAPWENPQPVSLSSTRTANKTGRKRMASKAAVSGAGIKRFGESRRAGRLQVDKGRCSGGDRCLTMSERDAAAFETL